MILTTVKYKIHFVLQALPLLSPHHTDFWFWWYQAKHPLHKAFVYRILTILFTGNTRFFIFLGISFQFFTNAQPHHIYWFIMIDQWSVHQFLCIFKFIKYIFCVYNVHNLKKKSKVKPRLQKMVLKPGSSLNLWNRSCIPNTLQF